MLNKGVFSFSNWSIRVKATFIVIVPFLVVLFFLSFINFWKDRTIFEQQIEQNSIQQGDLLLSSLRQGMMRNDQSMLRNTLIDVLANKTITRVWIINQQQKIMISSNPDEEGILKPNQMVGCEKCHQFPEDQRPRVIQVDSVSTGVMRISTPIQNSQQCWNCHPVEQTHLGVLLIDVSMFEIEQRLQQGLLNNLFLSIFFSSLLGVGVYFIMNSLIVSRIENLHKILIGYSEGNFKVRVPADGRRFDEIASFGKTFNQMADGLEEHETLLEERARVREIAIVEERERIARELHDGIAQFLGYVITKVEATRLFILKGNLKKADEFMHQIENEARNQALDVRSSILGLKVFAGKRNGLANDLRESLVQSNRFMDLEVSAEVDERLENLNLDPETELQLLRIVQEAVSNIRKHSRAKKARVGLEYDEEGFIHLSIIDNGVGFDPDAVGEKSHHHFGLLTMRERAEAIGGVFKVLSAPHQGTTISVTILPPEKKE